MGWEKSVKNNYEVKDDSCPPCILSGTLKVTKVPDDYGVVLDTVDIYGMLEFGAQVRNLMSITIVRSRMSFISLVRNPQFPPRH